jgi:hypothetical protein
MGCNARKTNKPCIKEKIMVVVVMMMMMIIIIIIIIYRSNSKVTITKSKKT